ncbi:hypothetical protein CL616_04725 [archaeon]|nr:hypothetical protein [archaeon]
MKRWRIIENILRITLIIALGLSIIKQDWFTLLVSSLALLLTFLPFFIEKQYKIKIPLDFEVATILFVYAGLFLGEITKFYEIFWWWDILLHAISAIAFGLIGFITLFLLKKSKKINISPIWVAIFAFCFVVSIGTIWEIFEFGVDQIFNTNMQKTGLIDTMWDLIADTSGALISVLAGYSFMKGNQKSYLSKLTKLFLKENPQLKL